MAASGPSGRDFGAHDRLYGLKDTRTRTQDTIEARRSDSHNEISARSTVTIDRINDRLKISKDQPSGYRLPEKRPDTDQSTDAQFLGYLHSREGERDKTFTDRDTNARIRRASKLGVDFTAQQGGKVHFMLDEIAMEDVVNKRNHKDVGWKNVTASELRHIYRNQEALKGSVVFSREGEEVRPPWEENPKLWESYRPGTRQPQTWTTIAAPPPRQSQVVQPPEEASALPTLEVRSPRRNPQFQPMRDTQTGCRCQII